MSETTVPARTPERWLPGKAAENNPLVAAVMHATEEHVLGLDAEIAYVENYLAGLKAMRHMAGTALGVPPPRPTHESAPPAALVQPAQSQDRYRLNANGSPSLSSVVRGIIGDNPDMPTKTITEKLKETGVVYNDNTVRGTIYVERTKAKKRIKQTVPGAGLLTDNDKLRRIVSQYVCKKGLASSDDITRDCGVDPKVIEDFMTHPWFMRHENKWRLTVVGNNEGVDY